MADVKLNAIVDGISGRVGKNVVMRQRGGRTFMSSRPTAPSVISDKQKAQRERFLQAAKFAKTILLVPEAQAEYEILASVNRFLSPYNAAISDFLTAPEVPQIDVSHYTGNVNNKIVIRTSEKYKLVSVNISILKADDSVIESGDATSTIATRLEWEYTTQQNVAALAGVKIMVIVQDRPGHEVTAEKVLA